MKAKILYFIVITFFMTGSLHAQSIIQKSTPRLLTSYPIVEFEKKRENVASWAQDLESEDTVSYRFNFKNTGAVDFVISSIETSCTCTAPEYTDKVPPDGVGHVILTTTFGQLKSIRSVYAVVKANSKAKFHKLVLEYLPEKLRNDWP